MSGSRKAIFAVKGKQHCVYIFDFNIIKLSSAAFIKAVIAVRLN